MLQAPTDIKVSAEQLADRNKAFDVFRKSYRRNEAMEENKLLLKERIAEAKGLTEVINGARRNIESIKNEIESLRREQAM
jgi:kinesin family protein 6/9